IEAGDDLTFSTFDYDTAATAAVPTLGANPGRALVSHRLLAQIASSIRTGDVVIEADQASVVVTSGRAEWRLPTMILEDYPTLPTVSEPWAELDADDLITAVEATGPAASDKQTTPPVDVVQIACAGGHLTFAAIDGYRVHTAVAPAKDWAQGFVLVNARRLLGIVKHLHGPVIIARAEGLLRFTDARCSLSTTLADASQGWNDWQKLLTACENSTKATAELDREEFAQAVRQVVAFTDESVKGFRHVELTFTSDELVLTGSSAGGSGTAAVSSEQDGPGLRMVCNAPYLLDALAACRHERVRLLFSGPTRAVGVCDGDGPVTLAVMPVRVDRAAWLDERDAA
ncbi:MAG TPA: DNA polymerase III subunit beta, partial [Mycobacteriales bacterium]|nr:DNA polymerase III subunit beta [Mycobacteriales bacterium]